MKKIICVFLLFVSVFVLGCESSEKRNFIYLCENDYIYTMKVKESDSKYIVFGEYYKDYKKCEYQLTLKKEEVRYIILNKLGIYASYNVLMTSSCMKSLDLVRKRISLEEKLNDYPEIDEKWIYDKSKLGNAISYSIVDNYGMDEDNIKRAYINEFLFNNNYDEINLSVINQQISMQKKSDYNTLALIENYSSRITNDEKSIYVSLSAYLKKGMMKNTKKMYYPEFYYFVDADKWLFIFSNGVIKYDALSIYEKELLYEISKMTNTRYLQKGGKIEVDLGRQVNKPFTDKTTYEEFMEAIRYLGVIINGLVYVDSESVATTE